jgi:hypothetical protein
MHGNRSSIFQIFMQGRNSGRFPMFLARPKIITGLGEEGYRLAVQWFLMK